MDIRGPISSGHGPSAVKHLTLLFAIRAGLEFTQQICLFDRKVFDNLLCDGLSDRGSSDFNASERSFQSSEVVRIKINVKFFSDSIDCLLVFGGPGTSEHGFILELTACDELQNMLESITEDVEITH